MRRARRGGHRPAGVRRLGADRRHRRAAPRQRRGPRQTSIPVTYVPARNTIFLSFALAWAETLGASDIFIGVNALDYSGYPDCRPEYIAAYEQMANLATKAGVEGTPAPADPHPADRPDQGADHRARPRAGRRLRADPQLLRPRSPKGAPAGPATRACCAAEGLRRGRPRGPGARPRRRDGWMTYLVKEIFYTLQGEGAQAGRPAVFCRFSGCNLWTGREKHRARAICQFCDTDFVGTDGPGGGRFATARDLAAAVGRRVARAGHARRSPYVVCTGGEPLLQLDEAAVEAFHAAGFEVAVETNGTQDAPAGLDWICVSPKAGAPLRARPAATNSSWSTRRTAPPRSCSSTWTSPRLLLQPMDGPEREKNTASGRRVLPGPPAVAAQPADPQVPGDPVMEDLPRVHLRGGPPPPPRPGRAQVRTPARPLLPGRGPRATATVGRRHGMGDGLRRTSRTRSLPCTTNSTTTT